MADTAAPTVPEDFDATDDAQLAELIAELETAFTEMYDAGSRDVPTLTQIANDLDRARLEVTAREAAGADADAELEALAARVAGTDTATDDDATDGADPVAETDEPETDETDEADAAEQLEPVAASARPNLGHVAARGPRTRPAPAPEPAVTITASAEVPGHRNGAEIDLDQLAAAFHARARQLDNGSPRAMVASVTVPYEHTASTDPTANARAIDAILADRQDDAQALVASGGWCAPTVPVFDLFDLSDRAGLIDLPTLGGAGPNRGGVSIPQFFGFGDVSQALWSWDDAKDKAADATDAAKRKPCLQIPCPTWVDCVPEAEGLCVTHGNLADRAWPELTRQFVKVVMDAHVHRLSASKIAKITGSATSVTPAAAGLNSDAAGDVLNVIDLMVADMRSQFRAGPRRVIELGAPDWIKPAIRASLAKRAGVDLLSVSDARITAYFTERGVRPQYLSDYQPMFSTNPATGWAASAKLLFWFAGAIVETNGGQIDLGVVRDSTLNSTNDFTAAWSEQFFCVSNRGPAAREATITLDVDGVTACCA